MEDFVGSLVPEGGEIMTDMLTNALSCVTEVMKSVSGDATLAVLAFGFVLARGSIRVIKRLAHIGG